MNTRLDLGTLPQNRVAQRSQAQVRKTIQILDAVLMSGKTSLIPPAVANAIYGALVPAPESKPLGSRASLAGCGRQRLLGHRISLFRRLNAAGVPKFRRVLSRKVNLGPKPTSESECVRATGPLRRRGRASIKLLQAGEPDLVRSPAAGHHAPWRLHRPKPYTFPNTVRPTSRKPRARSTFRAMEERREERLIHPITVQPDAER